MVDDDADSLDLLTRWLSMEGYDVLSARSGTEALQRIEGDRPDLILLDLIIPPPDGIGVIRAVIEAEESAVAHYNKVIKATDGEDYVTEWRGDRSVLVQTSVMGGAIGQFAPIIAAVDACTI